MDITPGTAATATNVPTESKTITAGRESLKNGNIAGLWVGVAIAIAVVIVAIILAIIYGMQRNSSTSASMVMMPSVAKKK